MRHVMLFAAAAATMLILPHASRAAEVTRLDRQIDNFTLRDFYGAERSLSDYADSRLVVVAFIGTECPLARLYAPRLVDLHEEFSDQGVTFLAISSNQQDSVTELANFARVNKIEFPVLKDAGNKVADMFAAIRTPEVFVLDADRVVRYWGRIDDQYGFQRGEGGKRVSYQLPEPRRRDLAIALDELLAGKPISVATTEAPGCHIGRIRAADESSEVTYSNQIARIFNANCVYCHREGQIGPFPLTSYDEAVGWAEMIDEVVQERRMPPWHADPRHGEFINDARLSDADMDLIGRWVAGGAPEGNPDDLPEPPQFVEGWMIPEPDEVIYMRDQPFDVPAEGVVDYQYFVVDPGWDEDKWITALEPVPGNPAVVHHIVMYIIPPDGPQTGRAGRLRTDWLAAFAPGLRPPVLPDEMARYFPKGAKLRFELHYTPNGTAQTDLSYIGVKFADPAKVKREVAVKNAGSVTFRIPPHDPSYRVDSNYTFREDTLLLSVSPHMHLRGKDFLYELLYPDGREETVLWVPQYDFGWQTTYTFTEPKVLPAGTKMHCVAHYDNSENNLNNPDPGKEVRFGEQTWEEMMFGWFEMALVDQDLTQPAPEPIARTKKFLENIRIGGGEIDEQIAETAAQAMDNEEDFKFFAYYVADVVPQIDRVDVTYVEDGRLKNCFVEELNGIRTVFRTPSTTLKADGALLAAYISREDPVAHQDLSQVDDSLLGRMYRKGIQSSLHVPVVIDGVPSCVSFWSTEPEGFPEPAVKLLADAAGRLGQAN